MLCHLFQSLGYVQPTCRYLTCCSFTNTDNGYDSAFDGYVEYIHDLLPLQLDACMNWTTKSAVPGPCNKYFTCVYSSSHGTTGSTPCPPTGLDFNSDPSWKTTYTLVDSDGFYSELAKSYGIPQDWVQLGTRDTPFNCSDWVSDGYTGTCVPQDKYQYNYPVPASNFIVPDPRDFFTNASSLNFLDNLGITIDSTALSIASADWFGRYSDVATALVMPVSMAVQASQSMADVVRIGNQQNEDDEKRRIFEILGAVFTVVPFLGDGLGAAADDIIAGLGRVIQLVGAAGIAGPSIYEIATNSTSIPLAIIGILAGVGGAAGAFGRDEADMANIASLRRGMTDSDARSLGEVFEENDGKIQKLCSSFCKA
jgi:hypothetical protein